MAVDKLVDSTQLNSDLTSIANAIRTKGGTSAQLAFPSGFVSAIGDIPTGSGGSVTQDQDGYIVIPSTGGGGGGGSSTTYTNTVNNQKTFYTEEMVIEGEPDFSLVQRLMGAAYLKSVKMLKATSYGGTSYQIYKAFYNCPLLESVQLLNGVSSAGYCEDVVGECPNLAQFITGDIGYPNTVGMGPTSGAYMMFRNITLPFDIIIYTMATSLTDVPAILTSGSPWGATNATIIYKNSVTGEVLS